MNQLFALLIIICSFCQLSAQEITGHVLDNNNEPVISAVVSVYQGGALKGGTVTDYDGNYIIKPLDRGIYTAVVVSQGFDTAMVTDITVGSGTTQFYCNLVKSVSAPKCSVSKYVKPMVDIPSQGNICDHLKQLPTTAITDFASVGFCPNPTGTMRTTEISLGGARSNSRSGGTTYTIDGIRTDSAQLAKNSIPVIEYITVCPAKCKVVTYDYYFKLGTMAEAISTCPGVYQARRGDDISIGGSRTSGVGYIVDGARIMDAQPERHLNIR